jgi:hypothetical protein
MGIDWQAAPASPSSHIVKKILRLDIPVDSYPNVSEASTFKHNIYIYIYIYFSLRV